MNSFIKQSVFILFGCSLFSAHAAVNQGWVTQTALDSSFTLDPAPFNVQTNVSALSLSAGPSALSTSSLIAPLQISDNIQEMAAALEYDPVKICEFVRNHIEYDIQFGWMRTPERTLIDGMGTDVDQAVLLAQLLQQSGYATAYVQGFIGYPQTGNNGYNLESWLGTTQVSDSGALFDLGGYAVFAYGTDGAAVHRYWVAVAIDGIIYHLDPAFKRHTEYSSLDVASMSGYVRSNLLASAGGIIGSNEVSQLNENALRTYLDTLSGNAINFIHSNHPNASVADVFGGKNIIPESGLCTNRAVYTTQPTFTSLPVELDHGFFFSHRDAQGQDANKYLGTLSLGSGEFSIIMDAAGTNGTMLRDGLPIFSGDLSPFGQMRITLVQPYAFYSGGIQFGLNQYDQVYNLNDGSTNAFVYTLGNADHSGMVRNHAGPLLNTIRQGNDSTLSSLHAIGDSWMNQMALVARVATRISGVKHNEIDYALGQFAADASGDFMDIKHLSDTTLAGSTEAQKLRTSKSMIISALEHGVFEQTQPGLRDAVSTVDVLTLAARDGQTIYRATSNNFAAISALLINYFPGELTQIQERIDDGSILILHEDGNTGLNLWEGFAFIASGEVEAYTISGGLLGGRVTTGNPFDPKPYYKLLIAHLLDPANNPHPKSWDPVDMVTGAFLLDHDDLIMNGPLPLRLSRHYNSDSRYHNNGMGLGWKHSFEISIARHSDASSQLGMRTPEDVASLAVALYAIQDLSVDVDTAKGWMTSVLIAKWAMDQLTHKAVTVSMGIKSITFIEQPDGSFIPPAGMAVSLSETNNSYMMQERHGNRYEFNTNGLIETLFDPDGNSLSFTYIGDTNLDQVTSSFGPQFTFDYTSNLLTSVTDNATPTRAIFYEYDANNNLTNFVDAIGEPWGITYDTDHKIKTLVDPEGTVTIQNFYNSVGQVINQISATGNSWNLYFTGTRNVEEDPLGNQTIYHIDRQQRTWSIEKSDGTRTYRYQDGQNHVTTLIDEAGTTNSYVYDVNHNLLVQTNAVGLPEQVVSTFGYDAEHHLRLVTNAVGTTEQRITEYTYTPEHHIDTLTEAKGTSVERITDLDYNPDGLLEKQTVGNGKRVTDYTYDANGNPDTVSSTDTGTIDYGYDMKGNMETMELDGKTTTYAYNDLSFPTGSLLADGTSTTRTYWDNRLLKTATDARGQTTQYFWTPAYKSSGMIFSNTGSSTNLYDDADRLVQTTDAELNDTIFQLDAVGRVTNTIGETTTVLAQYDAVGNLTNSVVDSGGLYLQGRFTYDALNRMTHHYKPIGHDEFQIDALGRTTNRIDAASKDWNTEYDELGRMKKTFRPSGNYEEYGYDALGNRTHFWNAEFKPMSFRVDAQGRVTAITNAIGNVTSFTFDDSGNLAQRTAADLKITDYGYDDLNRLVAVTNEGVEVAAFDHDDKGNVTSMVNNEAAISLGYDSMDRLVASTSFVSSVNFVVNNEYDLNGNRTNIVYPGGLSVGYEFGPGNRLETVAISAPAAPLREIDFSYDTASRLTGIAYPNGVNSTFGLDAESRIISIQHGNFVDRTIVRNVLGFKQTELIDAGIAPTAPATARRIKTHNDADQLVSEWEQTATYTQTVSYAYNDNGCLTNIFPSVQSAEFVDYTYDYENRITSAVQNSQFDIRYVYDATGARVGRIDGSTTNYFVIDYTDGLKRPLAETDASGTVTRYYIWSGSQLLCHIEANGDVRYYHSDELGSTLALTDASGTVTDEFAYMPYGYATRTGTTQTPFQWLGGYGVYYDSTTDLHLTLHRAYSSKLKRFIHPDPLGIDGGANIYAWANLNPLAFIDPYGLEPSSAGGDAWYNVFSDWLFEKGDKDSRSYDAGDQVTRDLMNDEGLQKVKDRWIKEGKPNDYSDTYSFGVKDYVRELFAGDGTGSMLGSYNVKISPNPDGSVTYTVTNTTGWESGTRSPIPSAHRNPSIEDMINGSPRTWNPRSILNNRPRSRPGPGGDFRQTYQWTE